MNTQERRERWRRIWRLGLYAGLLAAIATWFVARRVAAELSERSRDFGSKLEQFAALRGKETRLDFNGQAFSVSTRVLDEPVERVLERFVELCSDGTSVLAQEMAEKIGPGSGLGASALQRFMVMRDDLNDEAATGVCLAGLGDGGLAGLAARVDAFSRSWDVSDLGQLRYTFVRKTGKGSHVLLVSADGPLALNELVPWDGREVKGPDVVPGVRPQDSTRLIAAAAQGTPHVVSAYRANAKPDAAIADYARQLEAAGYQPLRIPSGYGTPYEFQTDNSTFTRSFRRGSHTLVATSRPDEAGSVLAVVQLEAAASH